VTSPLETPERVAPEHPGPAAPEPVFEVLGASGRRHAAVPALEFEVHVSEPEAAAST